MTVKQYVSFLPPFVMRVIFASIGRVDVAADMFNLSFHKASRLLDRTKTNLESNIAEFVYGRFEVLE
jgi:DNA relaxase NicK